MATVVPYYRNYDTEDTTHDGYTTGTIVDPSVFNWTAPEGYRFSHWNSARDGSGKSWAPGDTAFDDYANMAHYAIWVPVEPTYLDMAGLAKYDSLVKVIINGKVDAGGKAGGIPYGSVDSTSTNTNFTATVDGLTELYDGACVMLHNGVVTSAKNFTININGLGAKKCYSNMTNATQETTIFNVAYTLMFVYSTALDSGNGGWWVYRGYDTNTTYTPVKLGFGYGHCTTAAATAAKAVAISGYTLNTGGIVTVLFDHDVQAGATLNVNSRGAKAIYHKGAAITDGVIKAGDTATFIYSGQYHLISIDHEAYTLPTATVTQLADGATITVTDEQGTTTATVHDGADGFSPTVDVQAITGGHEVTITDTQGPHTFDVMDGSDAEAGLVLLEYGKSTWADFKSAYDAKRIVYCRVAYGAGSRLAFMAWYESSKVEFQYYRSVNGHTAAQQCDEVYVYTLTSGNKWTTTTRQTNARVVAGSGLSSTYANDVLTLKLPPATTSTLGGVKVGDGLSVESDGTLSANGIADGSVTTDKLANGAVTTDKLDFVELETDGTLESSITRQQREKGGIPFKLIATDATSQAIAQQLGGGELPPILTPADLVTDRKFMYDAYMLVWLNGTVVEGARLQFYGVLNGTNATPYVYAKGNGSMASGILGMDDSWTITALPTDADGVSY